MLIRAPPSFLLGKRQQLWRAPASATSKNGLLFEDDRSRLVRAGSRRAGHHACVAGSELEKKLTEACSNEPWGASGTMLSELARATFSYDDFKTVMVFVWKNLQLTGSLWRVVYKTLNLLDHLVRNGSERVIEDARDHLRELKALQKFEAVDTEGKDTGVNVREKARSSSLSY